MFIEQRSYNTRSMPISPIESTPDYLRRIHRVLLELRKLVNRYIKGLSFKYDYLDDKLPDDGQHHGQ
jgi:hypothetical protein